MKAAHKVILGLVFITLVVIQLYWSFGSTRVYEIAPDRFRYIATDDREQGGISTSELTLNDHLATLNCNLSKSDSYDWPYCGITILLGDSDSQGLDFSQFHTIRLNVDFEQLDSDASPSLRFYLRNFNPAYSTSGVEYSLKYNGLSYTPGMGNGDLDIPINNLQVLTWWLADNYIPLEHSAPEYTNVSRIDLASGSGHYSGQYRMTVRKVELIGHYVSGEHLMLALLMVWVATALTISIIEIRSARRLVRYSQKRQAHLSELNRELKQQNVNFAEIANRDALTGAMNRHSIRDWLEQNYNSRLEEPRTLSILYLDIDHFKSINDSYGHLLGDDVLKEFTMVVLSCLNVEDRLVRWGGEEFVIFCPNRDLNQASSLAEIIRINVEKHQWVHGGGVTTSIGVTCLADNERTSEMLARADEALYAAKHQGRNRVVVNQPLV